MLAALALLAPAVLPPMLAEAAAAALLAIADVTLAVRALHHIGRHRGSASFRDGAGCVPCAIRSTRKCGRVVS